MMQRRRFQLAVVGLTVLASSVVTADVATAAPSLCSEKVQKIGGGFELIEMPQETSSIPSPWTEPKASAFVVDRFDPRLIYVATATTLQRSTDGGCTWKEVFRIPSLVSGAPVAACSGPLRSVLEQLTVPAGCGWISDVDIGTTEATRRRLYVQVTTDGRTGDFGTPRTTWIYRSDDGGDTFSLLLPTGLANAQASYGEGPLAIAPSDPETLYLVRDVTLYKTDVFVSRDGGATWENKPLPGIGLESTADNKVVVNPADPGDIWARVVFVPSSGTRVSHSELMRSTDFGTTWKKIEAPIADSFMQSLDLAATPSGLRVAVVADYKGFVSKDAGQSWSEFRIPDYGAEAVFGRGGRFLFISDSATVLFLARVDLNREVYTTLKDRGWRDQNETMSSTGWPPSVVPGAGFYLLHYCQQLDAGPLTNQSCSFLIRFQGKGV